MFIVLGTWFRFVSGGKVLVSDLLIAFAVAAVSLLFWLPNRGPLWKFSKKYHHEYDEERSQQPPPS